MVGKCLWQGRGAFVTSGVAMFLKVCILYLKHGRLRCSNAQMLKPKRRSWILVFSRKERKDRKAYRDGGVLQDFQAYPLF